MYLSCRFVADAVTRLARQSVGSELGSIDGTADSCSVVHIAYDNRIDTSHVEVIDAVNTTAHTTATVLPGATLTSSIETCASFSDTICNIKVTGF
jgi:hypothetical protein